MSKVYRNRYGVEYSFEPVSESTLEFKMDPEEMKYCRWGGIEGQESIDTNNLGFFDPSGGPFISLGSKIDGRIVSRIFAQESKILLEMTDK